MLGLEKRSTQEELMDDFQGTQEQLKVVLDDISRVNRLLGGNKITVNAVAELIRKTPQDSYLVADVGCADGTMLRELASYCRTNHIKAEFIGIDLSHDALSIARNASIDFPEIRFLACDVMQLSPSDLACDSIISTLTTHHFTNAQLPILLQQFANLAKLGFVNNDLHRNGIALVLYKLFSMVFIKTHTARVDGLISIRRGFKKQELQALAKQLPKMEHRGLWNRNDQSPNE